MRRALGGPEVDAAKVSQSILDTLRGESADFLGSEGAAPSFSLTLDAAARLVDQDVARLQEFVPDVERSRFLLFVSNVMGAARDTLSSESRNSIFSEITVNSLTRSLVGLVVRRDEDLELTVLEATRRLASQERAEVLRRFVLEYVTGLLGESVHHFIGREWQKVGGSLALPTPADRKDLEEVVQGLCRQAAQASGFPPSLEELIQSPDIRGAGELARRALIDTIPVTAERIGQVPS